MMRYAGWVGWFGDCQFTNLYLVLYLVNTNFPRRRDEPYKTAKARKIIHANGASHDLKFDRHAESAKIVIVFLGLELARTKYVGVTKAYI